MKLLLPLLLAASLMSVRADSFPGGPEVGQQAPALKVTKWLQAPPEAANGWPTGKVTVLEFWATWCGPCVAAIPHLNELAEQFKDKPVQFIAVTDEEEDVVRAFLQKKPMHAWIGLSAEAGFGTNKPYQVRGIPHTVLIDRHGRIAAISYPTDLTSHWIELCLADKPVPGANEPEGQQVPGAVPGQHRIGRKPLFQVLIRPPSMTNQIECWGGEGLTLQPGQLKTAIVRAFDVESTRIVAETELPEEWYDFYIALPDEESTEGRTRLETVFAQSVEMAFGLTVRREVREMEVYVLKTNATSLELLARSTNSSGGAMLGWNEVRGTGRPLSFLARGLEHAVRKPVLDETALTNRYSFHIQWDQKLDHPNPEGMTAAVKGLGLDLVPAKRSMEVVVVRKVSKPEPRPERTATKQ